MRPIERGVLPTDADGEPISFHEYQDARGELIARIGEYCSYCEMHLDASLAVEHIIPKDSHPEHELNWQNFLLACANCNSTKGDDDLILEDYYWPHVDNTALALEYIDGGRVRANNTLSQDKQDRAWNTIKLTGLDRTPIHDPQMRDRRWLNRLQAWNLATEAKSTLASNDNPHSRTWVVRCAQEKGFWSVWMAVFSDDADMRQRLTVAFPGTK